MDKVGEDLLVEVFVRTLRRRRLQGYGRHDQWDELGHFLVDELLVELIHEHHNDGQLLQALEGQHRLRDEVVRDRLLVLRHRLLLGRDGRHGERLAEHGLQVEVAVVQVLHFDRRGAGLEDLKH